VRSSAFGGEVCRALADAISVAVGPSAAGAVRRLASRGVFASESVTNAPGARGPSNRVASFRYTQRLADLAIAASVGSVADAYDNAMAESFVATLKTEIVAGRVFPTRFDAEITLAEYLGWLNHSRLRQALDDIPPAEFEALCAPRFETITTPTTTTEPK
jgi:transposase InsO family protein